ncbi:ubiquinone biosynthesis accessory factor UbiJ [Vibrio salinus]|uniref:ubiquinone biosynthesis accessory factor UbiJ n=1 Tax=Vibrio salinus TaxID=2899784 RepID=UPI001E42D3B2|nr:SCP2 sterol-binding domain-containing protein [Vibrio salinus]MCE0493570.1 SCP2 sterol-binding domain-containing protein [Vibrio salinus]
MPLEILVNAVIETGFNYRINQDSDLSRQCLRLKGKVFQLHIKEVDKTLTFVFSHQVDVLGQYEGVPDCYLSLSLKTLPQLREQVNITQLIKQEQLELEGDLQLAQKFAVLLSDAEPDAEEWLSQWVGDVVAHTVVHTGKQLLTTTKQQTQKKRNQFSEVLTEEWKVFPPALEIAYFCDQVEVVKQQVDKLELRFQALMEKL